MRVPPRREGDQHPDQDYQLWVVPADDAGGLSATPAFSETFTVLPP